MTGFVRGARLLAIAWAALALGSGVLGLSDVAGHARTIVVAATVLAVGAASAAVVALTRGRTRVGGVALMVAGIAAPTFGLAALDVIPLVVGAVLAVRAEPRR